MSAIHLQTPLTKNQAKALRAGDRVLLSGTIFTARDSAHKRLINMIENNRELPFPVRDSVIYYAGPAPAPPGRPIGSVGPTTSYRMDPYTPQLLEAGLTGTIGKGTRSDEVRRAIADHGAVYFAAWGGAGALISHCVKRAEVVAFPELGPEAVYRLDVEDFPLLVVNDSIGQDYYEIVGGK